MSAQRTLLLCAVISVSCVAARAQDATFTRKLSTSERPDLYVSTNSGDVTVAASGEGEASITIVGHVHAQHGAGTDARERVQRIASNPPIQQAGNTVHVGEAPDRSLYNNITVSYEIRAPHAVALNLRSGSGNIVTKQVGRFLAVESGSGNIDATAVAGPADLHTGSGEVSLQQAAPGPVKLQSGSGNLHLADLDGTVQAHTGSGDVAVDGSISGPSEIRTGSGSVRLHITRASRFHLEATVGSGSIHSDVPGLQQRSEDGHRLEGDLNGGGSALRVETGSGDVEIRQ